MDIKKMELAKAKMNDARINGDFQTMAAAAEIIAKLIGGGLMI